MQNDKELIISTGRNRKETAWKQQRLLWSEFLQRLSIPQKSGETLEEYKKLPKGQQDDLKDVGGYIGGALKGGRRRAGSVEGRCLITLDMDNIPAGQTGEILKRVGSLQCASAIYSTRKHEPAAPRLRVIIPTDRVMTSDEYEAAARKLAELVGIGFCDPTTFQAARFMYWPSICRNAEYVFTYIDGGFIQADWLLGRYTDWRNTAEWPTVDREVKRLERSLKRQEEPTEKQGLIGAFCRAYDVPEAIEKFLPDIYEPCGEGRYTYTGGSTTGGAVLYEDGKFLYSHHATDPAGERLNNSFDMVRLHKFGHMDENSLPGTFDHQLLSTKAMIEFASQDEAVKAELAKELFKDKVQQGEDWLVRLEWINGKLAKTAKNIMLILENDPELCGKFRYDKFSERIHVKGALPWNPETEERDLRDTDMSGLRVFLEETYLLCGKEKIQDAFDTFLEKTATHAVKNYLDGLIWDGIPRLDRVFIDYLGAEDTEYNRKVARTLFCAGVARIYAPGQKFDYLVVLIGAQGTGKSTFVRIMGVDWFSDSLKIVDMKDKTALEKLLGIWVVELSEMDGFSKVDTNTIKSFLSAQSDRFRPAYGHHAITRKRQFIPVGTSNKSDFLIDETGNRRFLPIDIGVISPVKSVFSELEPVINQIWAEAVLRWKAGERTYLDAEMALLASQQQERHMQEDPREGMIEEFLKKPIPVDWYSRDMQYKMSYCFGTQPYQGETMPRHMICAAEIWVECFRLPLNGMKQSDARQINAILTKLLKGWKRDRPYFGAEYGRQRGFVSLSFVPPSVPPSVPSKIQ